MSKIDMTATGTSPDDNAPKKNWVSPTLEAFPTKNATNTPSGSTDGVSCHS